MLIACGAARGSETEGTDAEGAATTVEAAYAKFFESYGVVQTVAGPALVDAARVYAYRLWELRASLDSASVMGPENFSAVARLARDASHDMIDEMHAELHLAGSVRLEGKYNPFVGTDLEEAYAKGERLRPGSSG